MNAAPIFAAMTAHGAQTIRNIGGDAAHYEELAGERVKNRRVILVPSAARPGAEKQAAKRLQSLGADVCSVPASALDGCLDIADLIEQRGTGVNLAAIASASTPLRIEADPKAISKRIVSLSIGELLTREFPPMEPLLAPWLCKQHLSMVYAWRGVGKTHFGLGVAYAVAGGGQFLKWQAEKPRRVVYIDGEMAGAAIKARIAAIVESSPNEHEPPEGYFRIITPDAQALPLPDLASLDGQAALTPHIEDAELIVVDNLSSLMRSGAENEGESWVPVAEWALSMRKRGKAVLFIHHAGKSNTQRGSSRREDLMDVVIKLDHTKDYNPEMGAAFTVKFEKARHLSGDDARDIEAALTVDAPRKQVWTWKDAELGMTERILALQADAPGLNQAELAAELGCNRSTVSRALKGAKVHGAGGFQ